jgi:hypothetical protein
MTSSSNACSRISPAPGRDQWTNNEHASWWSKAHKNTDGTTGEQLTSHSLTVICTCLAICRSWALYTTAVSTPAVPLPLVATGTPDRASTVGCWATSHGWWRPGAETAPELWPKTPAGTQVCAVLLEMTASPPDGAAPAVEVVPLPDCPELAHADEGAQASATFSSSPFGNSGPGAESSHDAGVSTVAEARAADAL